MLSKERSALTFGWLVLNVCSGIDLLPVLLRLLLLLLLLLFALYRYVRSSWRRYFFGSVQPLSKRLRKEVAR